jgi:hypothetical protein
VDKVDKIVYKSKPYENKSIFVDNLRYALQIFYNLWV